MERLYEAARRCDPPIEGQSAVARALGESPQTVKNWEQRGVSQRGLVAAQRTFSADAAWIATGVPTPKPSDATGGASDGISYSRRQFMPSDATRLPINLEDNPDYPSIRRVRFKLSAGISGFAVEYLDSDDAPIVFQRKWYSSRGFRPERLFAIKVMNGSMEPGLHHGDTVVVNTDQTQPKDGIAFAVNYEGEAVVKRLVRDQGAWWLHSDNPLHPRKLCDENTHILGEIVHKQSEHI